jgi:hypothetical protein
VAQVHDAVLCELPAMVVSQVDAKLQSLVPQSDVALDAKLQERLPRIVAAQVDAKLKAVRKCSCRLASLVANGKGVNLPYLALCSCCRRPMSRSTASFSRSCHS